MEEPEARAFHSAWTTEREKITARQDAELARLDRRLELDRANAQATYEHNFKLLDGLPPRQYGEILLCFRDNLVLRQEKAEMQHATLRAAKQEEHKKELEAHFGKFHLAMKRNPSPASIAAGIPSPVSCIPASRANSILHTIEVKSPATEAGYVANSIAPSTNAVQEEAQTISRTSTTQSPPPGLTSQDLTIDRLQNNTIVEQPLQPAPSAASEQTQSSSKRPLEPDDASETITCEDHIKEPLKKKKKNMPTPPYHKPLTDRVKTWEAVSTDETHYDAIVEYPSDSGLFYVVFCEEHGLHFKNGSPLLAAAKHLHSNLHGTMSKHWNIAVEHLGYLVTGCDREKQMLHNQKVEAKFAAGYVPQTNTRFFNSAKSAKTVETSSSQPVTGAAKPQSATPIPHPSTPALKPTRPSQIESPAAKISPGRSAKGIVHPKEFHIYLGKWPGVKGPSFYPVMILGWDSQKGSGLPGTLNDTQLLDQGSDPPGCYEYDVAFEKIIGWAAGYEDGGPKVGSRKFPVLFFDQKRSASWIPAGALQKYGLYETMTDRKDIKKQQEVRDFIASREGFTSWAAYQQSCDPHTRGISKHPSSATQEKDAEMADRDIDNMDLDDYDSSLECETSSDAEELNKLLETCGEIPGDNDYSASQNTTQSKEDVDMVEAASPKTVYRKSFISTRSSDMDRDATKPDRVKRKLMGRRSVSGEQVTAKPGIESPTTTRPTSSYGAKSKQDLPQKPLAGSVEISANQDMPKQQGIDDWPVVQDSHTIRQKTDTQKKLADSDPIQPVTEPAQSKERSTTHYGSPSLTQKDFAQISSGISPAPSKSAQRQSTESSTGATQNVIAAEPATKDNLSASTSISEGSKDTTVPSSKEKSQASGEPAELAQNDKSAAMSKLNDHKAQIDTQRVLGSKPASEPQNCASPGRDSTVKPVTTTPTVSGISEGTKQAGKQAVSVDTPDPVKPVAPQAPEVVRGWAVANQDFKETQVNTNTAPIAPRVATPMSATPISNGTSAVFSRDSSVATSTQSPIMSSRPILPVQFSVLSYSQGATKWEKMVPQDKCIKVSSEGPILRSQVGSPVQIMIDPCAMWTFRRQPYGLDNYTLVLMPAKANEPAMHIVFGTDAGAGGVGNVQSGKTQSRKFVRWMQAINPQLVASEACR